MDNKNKKTKPIFVDNYTWLSKLKYINFLREIGSHFTVNKMLTFDSVKIRLEREQSLSYMEFNYMILQAFDFYQLYRNKDCLLQIGGSDQWGNIVNGVELVRKILKKEAIGLTTPLITLSSGAKMGKTEKGAIWLDEKLFSAYDYWQYWRNTDDRDVKRFLNFFTEMGTNEIDQLINKEKNINNLKIILANETTSLLHGKVASKNAEKTAKETFETGGLGSHLPEIKIKKRDLEKGINILDFLSINKIVSSKSDARRAIKGNALKINNETLKDEKKIIQTSDFQKKNFKDILWKKETLFN